VAEKKFPVTSRQDVLPSANSFPKKTRGKSYDHAMNEPNDPRPADDPCECQPDADGQGFIDRDKESYNVTESYWGNERINQFTGEDESD
jgi:hypothetical protein